MCKLFYRNWLTVNINIFEYRLLGTKFLSIIYNLLSYNLEGIELFCMQNLFCSGKGLIVSIGFDRFFLFPLNVKYYIIYKPL